MIERATTDNLLRAAKTGMDFEDWKKSDATQALLKKLQVKASAARELCTELSPHTQLKELVEAQLEVRVFKEAVAAIDEFINEGNLACAEIIRREESPHSD